MTAAALPIDWTAWRKEWQAWRDANAAHLERTSWVFPGVKNLLADEVLGKWSVNGRNVELSEVTFPDLGVRPHRSIRYVGVTFSTGAGAESALCSSFTELEEALGITYECMNCGEVVCPSWTNKCRDELGARCRP